ncbi:MAG: hypothetical protein LUI12_02790 [Clostridiales bacterium]|nr:hypothetical protein [Clostridiales bacterium]
MEVVRFGICVSGILAIRKAAWGYISRRLQYSLWILALIFLLLNPVWNITSRFSIENILFNIGNITEAQLDDGLLYADNVPDYADGYAEGYGTTELSQPYAVLDSEMAKSYDGQAEKENGRIFVLYCLEAYWQNIKWVVSFMILSYLLLSNVSFYIWCRRKRCFYKREEQTGLAVYLLKNIRTPFLFGRTIYIDADMAADSKMLRHMITHEYCHYKHLDYVWVWLRGVCFALNWYNPFLWVAIEFMKRDCELACDEAAIAVLGVAGRKEYGYTLLKIAGKRKAKAISLTATTSMNSNFKRLKERILMISRERNTSAAVTVLVMISMLLLAGCTFTRGEQMHNTKTEETTEASMAEIEMPKETEPASVSEDMDVAAIRTARSDDTSNIVYNSVKYYDGYFYFADSQNLKRIDKELAKEETLAYGNVKLGNCDGDFIYYIRYASDTNGVPGILRLNLTNLEEELLVEWSDQMWSCTNIYETENIIYIEGNQYCDAYRLENDMSGIKDFAMEETDHEIYKKMEQCGIAREKINAFAAGYCNAMFQYHKFVYLDRNNEKIIVYDTDSGEAISEIENCGSDVLLTENGLVYKDSASNIYFRKWENSDSALLYDIDKNNGLMVNYGTYDDQYIYGFYEDNGGSTLVKISWTGECKKDKFFQNEGRAVNLGFSVNNGIRSYWQNGHIIFEGV